MMTRTQKSRIFIVMAFAIIMGCDNAGNEILNNQLFSEPDVSTCDAHVVTSDLYYTSEDEQFLWAGEDSTTHFNITNWTLNACNLYYGLGREHFKALITPKFDQFLDVKDNIPDNDKVVVVQSGETVKAYPYSILVQHEAVNDVVDGQPIMVVYCFLADLTVVYSRRYCNRTLTFGVSGYTYADRNIRDGLESFVLWDRDSESLWWPIIDKGVSGAFKNRNMIKYSSSKWEVIRWSEFKEKYDNGLILQRGQTMTPPEVRVKMSGC